MRMLPTYLLGFILLSFSFKSWGQDPNFTQFYNNPMYYNPAMTGINNGFSFHLNGRNLWGPIPGKFNTFSVSAESQSLFKTSFGVHAFTDVAGEAKLRTSGGYFNYSYRAVDTKNLIVQAGLGGGFITKHIDYSKLTFSDQLDETLGKVRESSFISPQNPSVFYADFNAGVVVRFNGKARRSKGSFKRISSTIGGALQHLSKPQDAFLGSYAFLPMKLVIHAHTNLLLNDFILSPGIVFEQQQDFRTITIGSNFVVRPFTLGFWLRNRTVRFSIYDYDSFIFNAGMNVPVKFASNCKVMYGYDLTISRLRTSSFGTHEISLIIALENNYLFQKRMKGAAIYRRFECPKDFVGY